MNMASGTEQDTEMAELLNSEEVARILGVKPDTLRQWRHKNRGPAYTRIERFIRYSRADLNAYIERNRSTP